MHATREFIAPPRRTRQEAGRIISAYASKAAHIIDDHERANQVRRQLGVRLWHDVPTHDFMELARTHARIRDARTTGEPTEWVDYLRAEARVHLQNLTTRYPEH